MTNYTWISFDIDEALAGKVVGFEQSQGYDLSKTGVLTKAGGGPTPYCVTIDGIKLWVNRSGLVVDASAATSYINTPLKMVTATMGKDGEVGSSVARTRGRSSEGHSATAVLSTMEPRDHFAMNVLNAMLVHMTDAASMDDASMLRYSYAAYRWAQAMMIAAADSREGTSTDTSPSSEVEIKADDLQSNTEKLLYNMVQYMKDGIVVKGTTAQGAEPIQTKVTEVAEVKKITEVSEVKKVSEVDNAKIVSMPNTTHVTVDGIPSVSVSNTPNVNVANIPRVSVNSMPSEPIEVEVSNNPTVSVSNMPSTPIDVKVSNMPSSIAVSNMPSEPIDVKVTSMPSQSTSSGTTPSGNT